MSDIRWSEKSSEVLEETVEAVRVVHCEGVDAPTPEVLEVTVEVCRLVLHERDATAHCRTY